jgi:hypothetical protein
VGRETCVFDLVLDCVHAGSGLGFVKLGFPGMRPVFFKGV